jgi:hypothetical protein
LINLVKLLLLFEKIVYYSKRDIDKGNTPLEIYKICSCIQETFCLSYSFGKENSLFLYFQAEQALIQFKGSTLKYLSSDERSQALLLEKALNKVEKGATFKTNRWSISTPGILVRKFANNKSLVDYIKSMGNAEIIFICDPKDIEIFPEINEFDTTEIFKDAFCIVPSNNLLTKDSDFFQLFKELQNIKFVTLTKIKKVEDKILYINFRTDH